MKRHPYLIAFSRFHRSILFLALIAKKNAPNVKGYPEKIEDKIEYALAFYRQLLLLHFEMENTKVLNEFSGKDAGLDDLIQNVRKDREAICEMFENLSKDKLNFTLFHELGERLEKHVRKEERELFQMIQEKCKTRLDQQLE
jgi:hemerythrin-like domain-containing protein